jgi:hypothetical protein
MSDRRRKGETIEQYARRLVTDYEDEAFLFSCNFCTGPESMGLCKALDQIDPEGRERVKWSKQT